MPVAATVAARAVLAAVFAVAAAAKLRDAAGFRRSLAEFGVPLTATAWLAAAIPAIEILIAWWLIGSGTAFTGGMAALGILAVFSIVVVMNLAMGRAPDCRCFGQIAARPIGGGTLVRNAVFGAFAAIILLSGRAATRENLVDATWTAFHTSSAVALAGGIALVIIVAQATMQWSLIRQHGRLLLRVEELERRTGGVAPTPVARQLPIGATAPAFALPSASGRSTSLADLLASGLPVLLVFSDPGCAACRAFLPTVAGWEVSHAGVVRIALLTGPGDQVGVDAGVRTVLHQRAREVADSYGVPATPGAVLVRPDGSVGSAVTLGAESITALLPPLTPAGVPPVSLSTVEVAS